MRRDTVEKWENPGLWENPPYYLSAYGIAVKHGYQGTEEEFNAGVTEAIGSKEASAAYAREAESWAHGGTESREGEETDNARAYAGLAEGYADKAERDADTAKQYSGNPPIIQNETWWIWNAERQEYEDTGQQATGNTMFAVFYLKVETGELYMLHRREYAGPNFRLNGPDLEVVINGGD